VFDTSSVDYRSHNDCLISPTFTTAKPWPSSFSASGTHCYTTQTSIGSKKMYAIHTDPCIKLWPCAVSLNHHGTTVLIQQQQSAVVFHTKPKLITV